MVGTVNINGVEYVEMKTLEVKDTKYAYLVNQDDEKDFIINKIVIRDGKEMYVGLDNDNEYDLALMYFLKNYTQDNLK